MLTIITHVVAFFVGAGGGAYAHYKWGSKLAALEAKVKSVL